MPSTRTQNLNIFSWNTFVLGKPLLSSIIGVCVGGEGWSGGLPSGLTSMSIIFVIFNDLKSAYTCILIHRII